MLSGISTTNAALPMVSTVTTVNSNIASVRDSNSKTGTAKLLINPDGTVRLMADPKNFPTPGLKDTHKLFAACTDNGHMHVYYSPSGNPSEVYLLKPTAGSEGKQLIAPIPLAAQHHSGLSKENLIIVRPEQTYENADTVKPIVISATGKQAPLNENIKSILCTTSQITNVIGNTNRTMLSPALSSAIPVNTNFSPLMSVSNKSTVNQSFSPEHPVTNNVSLTLPVSNREPFSSTDSSKSSSPELSPSDSVLSMTDIGSTIAAHLEASAREKTLVKSTEAVITSVNSLQKNTYVLTNTTTPYSTSLINQCSNINSNTTLTTSSCAQSSHGTVVILPPTAGSNTQYIMLPTTNPIQPGSSNKIYLPVVTAPQSASSIVSSQNASQMMQSLVAKANNIIQPPSVSIRPQSDVTIPTSCVTRPSYDSLVIDTPSWDENKNNGNLKGDNYEDNSPLNIRIDSVFSLSATNEPEVVKKACKRKKKKRNIDKYMEHFKIVEVEHNIKCKPLYVVLERLSLNVTSLNIKDKALQTQCSDHCRKRTLNCLCGIGLLDCKHPVQNRTIKYFERRKIEISYASPSKLPKLETDTREENTKSHSYQKSTTMGVECDIRRQSAVKENKENEVTTPNIKVIKSTDIKTKPTNAGCLKFSLLKSDPTYGSVTLTNSSHASSLVPPFVTNKQQSLLKTVTPIPTASHDKRYMVTTTQSVMSSKPNIILSNAKSVQSTITCPSVLGKPRIQPVTRPLLPDIDSSSNAIPKGRPIQTYVVKPPNTVSIACKPNITNIGGIIPKSLASSVRNISNNAPSTATFAKTTGSTTVSATGSGKFFLLTVDGKSVLIPADNKQSSKAFVINAAKDGTQMLTPASITYSKITTNQPTATTSSIPTTVMPISSSATGLMNLKSIVTSGVANTPAVNIVVQSGMKHSVTSNVVNSDKPKTTNIVTASLLQKNVISETTTTDTSAPSSDSTKKRKKTLAERYPLPPGVVIKQEPRTTGYGDELLQESSPVIGEVTARSVAQMISNSLTNRVHGKSTSIITSTLSAPSNIQTVVKSVLPLTGKPVLTTKVRNIPKVRNIAPQIVRTISPTAFRSVEQPLKTVVPSIVTTVVPQSKIKENIGQSVAKSLSQPVDQQITTRPATQTVMPSSIQHNEPIINNTSYSTPPLNNFPIFYKAIVPRSTEVHSLPAYTFDKVSAPLLEPTVTFATMENPSTSFHGCDLVIGEDSGEINMSSPESPGPPDLGEPQIILPTKTAKKRKISNTSTESNEDNYMTTFTEISNSLSVPITSTATLKTPQELRIEKLKQRLREHEKELEEMRRQKAIDDPSFIDDLLA